MVLAPPWPRPAPGAAMVLWVFKPEGLTRCGWRRRTQGSSAAYAA